ncbi:hypothetical protein [Herbaspirillum sp. RV1423]|uniref:hypothetical protein n=1 Tax=Herbaspirillum sp. RV1423 TaxID=1443993 RepID=UPI00054EA526|nr:hypothetical protein [Herbaspirillum sp. RV1423]
MSKVYIAVTDTESATHGCVVDLEAIPESQSKKASNPWEQGAQIGEWLKSDLPRATSIIDAIAKKTLSKESQSFIERVARLGVSLKKTGSPSHPMDALITFMAPKDQFDFLFTSPASASRAYEQAMSGA